MVTEQNKRLLNFSYIVSHNLRSHTANIQSLAIHIKESKNPKEKQKLIRKLFSFRFIFYLFIANIKITII